MIKQSLFALSLALLAGGVCLKPAPASAVSCPGGWSQTVQRKAGLGTYPALCNMVSCRPASASAHGHTLKQGTDPLCNPVTGANCGTITFFHYDYVLGATGPAACPADVSAGPWLTSAS